MKHVRHAALAAVIASIPAFAAAATPQIAATVPHLTFRDLGRAAPTTPVSIAVTLNYRNAAQLQQLIALQNDERSPYYRHWLTSREFDANFAPTSADYVRVIRSLQSGGFRVVQTYANRSVIDAIGTVAAAERYFDTRIDRVSQAGYRGLRYVNVTPGYVPANLYGLIGAVTGLHNLSFLHTHFMPVRRAASADLLRRYAAANASVFGPVSSVSNIPGYTPFTFTRAYDFPIAHNAKYDGLGTTSAIVIDADFKDSDLAGYLSYYKIKRTGPATKRVLVESAPPPSGSPSGPSDEGTDNLEATLDVEALVGTSPGTALWMYEVTSFDQPNSNQAVVDAFNKIVNDNKVDSVNTSFGACEDASLSYDEALDHAAEQGAALGITFHASTGDTGAYACANASTGSLSVSTQVPASSDYVVAVGGTSLIVDKTGHFAGEYGWDSGSYALGQSGGGVSDVFLLPSWQRGVPHLTQLARNIPDVSFAADPLTGMALYYFGSWNTQWNPIGGTSLASPLLGSAIAQMVQVTGGRLGLLSEKLYTEWRSTGYAKGATTYFHDSVLGNNTFYVAGPGYDNVTGIGSVDIWNAMQSLKKK